MSESKSGKGSDRPVAGVTGASSGIGEAYARALAARGFDLILVARRKDRLESLRDALQASHGVSVRILAADLSDPAEARTIERAVAGEPNLEVLVNNAGFGLTGRYDRVDRDRQAAMIEIHVTVPALLTRAALPAMIARGKGAIVNVASIIPYFALPGNVGYSATKSFLIAFTRTLRDDLAGTGVRVQALCPGFTHTEMHDTPEGKRRATSRGIPEPLFQTAEAVVAASLRGLDRDRAVVIPGWKNKLLVGLGRLIPSTFVRRSAAHRKPEAVAS